MTRKEMLTKIIHKYGFEHKHTIEFAKAEAWMGAYALSVFWYELMYESSEDEEDEEEED